MTARFDALLYLSFGGPEGPDEVMPFLENVVRGRGVPPERLEEVAKHYLQFGGVSPINGLNRDIIEALRDELTTHQITLPIYFGNRNWHPMLEDTLREMSALGVRRALAFTTSAYAGYSGCRQYLDDIARARARVGDSAPVLEKLRLYYNHPAFVAATLDQVRSAREQLPVSATVHLACTAHSVPLAMARASAYVDQLQEVAGIVATELAIDDFALVYQSRSGPAHVPWLEPDICNHLRALAARGVEHVIVAPIGFVSDHMEVLFDLDTEAAQCAAELGMTMVRAATVGTHPGFVPMIRELVLERLEGRSERPSVGARGPSPDTCPADCCPMPVRPQPRP